MKDSGKLSEEMQQALEVARAAGGKLFRQENTFWGGSEEIEASVENYENVFSTQVVRALVARRLMRFTEYRSAPSGRFPIEAELLEEKH